MINRLSTIFKGIVDGFYEHRLLENASALSYYTLMSLVPILAVLFGIAKGFGIDAILEQEVLSAVPQQEVLAEKVIQFARKMLDESKGGLIAGVGILLLLWSFVGLLSNFERALNDIWDIKVGRSYSRKVVDFLGFILICPFFLVIISSLSLFITSGVVDYFESQGIFEEVRPYLSLTFKLLPVFITFLVFSFFYIYLPNLNVPIGPALLAALFTSLLFHLVQWGYVAFQLGISRYGTVYGSFAAVPLFLFWLQISWLITLLGAEISYRFSKN